MANLILVKGHGKSQGFMGWKETRHKALALWKRSRSQIKVYARIYNPSRDSIRITLEEVDEWIRDYLYEPENMKSDFPELFFDFEKDSSHRGDERKVIPEGTEIDDKNINKATSYVPGATPFLEGGKILRP